MEMTSSDGLKTMVTNLPTSRKAKVELLALLWANSRLQDIQGLQLKCAEPYLEYYSAQCDLFSIEQSYCLSTAQNDPKLLPTHRDIVRIAQLTVETRNRHDLLEVLRNDLLLPHYSSINCSVAQQDEALDIVINWCVRILTMTAIGQIKCAFSPRKPLEWKNGSLQDFLTRLFTPEKPCTTQVRLEKAFTVRNLERLTGLRIEWTNDLASHLSLREDDTKLLIFHYATFLSNSHTNIFPPGLRQETLRTLALLLPSRDRDCKMWYRKQQKKYRLDCEAIQCPRLRSEDRRIDTFYYWRERLCILKQLYDDAEPSTLTQWWFDRRKGPQWYTFWVAVAVLILTIFFGIIQSIEGALQAYKAWYPE